MTRRASYNKPLTAAVKPPKPKIRDCPACNGEGRMPDNKDRNCTYCGGTGKDTLTGKPKSQNAMPPHLTDEERELWSLTLEKSWVLYSPEEPMSKNIGLSKKEMRRLLLDISDERGHTNSYIRLLHAAEKQRDDVTAQRDALVAQLAALFDWSDKSYLHATLHIENAVRNLRADLAVARKAKK